MKKRKYPIWSIERIANMIRKSQEEEFDFIIIVTGRRGLGKSTFAVKLGYRLGNFNPRRDIVFTREDAMKQLSTREKGIIICDEMINVSFNRDFWSEDQKNFIKLINMYRDKGNVLICCVPNFATMDKQFLNLIKMRVDISRKGLGILHKPHQSSYLLDQWDMKLNESIERRWLFKKLFKPKFERLSTFRGIVKFNDLGKKQRILYKKIKEEKRNLIIPQVQLANAEKEKNIYDNVIKYIKERGMTKTMLQHMCLVYGIDYTIMLSGLNTKLKNLGEPSVMKLLSKEKTSDIFSNEISKKIEEKKLPITLI